MKHPEFTKKRPIGSWLERDGLIVFGGLWGLLFLGSFFVAAPWAGFHGILLGVAGGLMMFRPPTVSLPRGWWILAAVFVLAGCSAFLPARWFAMPEWRSHLESLGVATGSRVTIQAHQAAETMVLFALTLLAGLWFAGHRASPTQLRLWAFTFSLGVALYAILAKLLQNSPYLNETVGQGVFGFFPNRNHTATYLAMGVLCGLGSVVQAIRDQRLLFMDAALATTAVCLGAVAGWSVSRGGLVLVVIGTLLWVGTLRTRYLGKHGWRVVGLVGGIIVGIFLLTDSEAKSRLSKTLTKTTDAIQSTTNAPPDDERPALKPVLQLDGRIPTYLDTLGIVRDFKWTGVGAGQFQYLFPQYRKIDVGSNDMDTYHPESDWLWMATEVGLPATLALAALVILAFAKAFLAVMNGRDRALRSACLVAAALVPIHGLFDVPGHRITLAWSAVFLYTLSLHAPVSADGSTPPLPPRPWFYRLAALPLLVASLWLIRAQWLGGPEPAVTAADNAVARAQELYLEYAAFQNDTPMLGTTNSPSAGRDRLEKALPLLQRAQDLVPLDREILKLQGFLALRFDDRREFVDRAFALGRALDPTWVRGPLFQAEYWADIDPQRTAALWAEALVRAEKLDQIQPGSLWSRERTLRAIQDFAKGKPALRKLVPGGDVERKQERKN